jgi:c-di-GMP-binding flagellar brake protein YcgR
MPKIVSNVISMDERTSKGQSIRAAVRDRRYAIRYPFAADAELVDLEMGTRAEGITSDISMGGCFVCASKPLPLKTRVRLTLTRKGLVVEALASVRIVKPRMGMGLEFLDIEPAFHKILTRWLEQLRDTR